jgi:15-cis-phytoene synthase/lycopene beta-cyclase
MITWWASVPLTLLWWGTSQSWLGAVKNGQAKIWLLCVALPSLYLCSADVYAMRRGTWHISEKRSLQFFVVPDLPIEEAIFFMATNTILASACFAFDRVVWQRRGEEVAQTEDSSIVPPLSPNYFVMDWSTVCKVWTTFTRLDIKSTETKETLEIQAQRDCSMDILTRASKSFSTAATLLPWDLRVDLGSLYAFARTMDDFIDQPMIEGNISCTDQRIKLLRTVASLAFDAKAASNRAIEGGLLEALTSYKDSGELLTSQQERDLCNSALSASLLRDLVPFRLWDDLIDGYSLDSAIGGPHFTTLEEQADYAQSVAGSVGEMCVRVVLGRIGISISRDYSVPRDVTREALLRSGEPRRAVLAEAQIQRAPHAPRLSAKNAEKMLRDARRMGVSLQLVNIARDVVKDSKELGRCYLVTGKTDRAGIRQALCNADFKDEESDEGEVADLVSPVSRISSSAIYSEKIYLLDLADAIYHSSIGAINLIPCRPAQTGLRVACAVYANIGNVIRRKGPQACMERSKAHPLERLSVAIKAVYRSST